MELTLNFNPGYRGILASLCREFEKRNHWKLNLKRGHMNTPQKTYDHFSRVSASYRELRTTDKEPIIFISESLIYTLLRLRMLGVVPVATIYYYFKT